MKSHAPRGFGQATSRPTATPLSGGYGAGYGNAFASAQAFGSGESEGGATSLLDQAAEQAPVGQAGEAFG
ncbi:MAG: hypothetical protein ACI8PZ_001763 [Myxococcota bacterium]|jgi:hypothetical protein